MEGTAFFVSPSVLCTNRHTFVQNSTWKLQKIVFDASTFSNGSGLHLLPTAIPLSDLNMMGKLDGFDRDPSGDQPQLYYQSDFVFLKVDDPARHSPVWIPPQEEIEKGEPVAAVGYVDITDSQFRYSPESNPSISELKALFHGFNHMFAAPGLTLDMNDRVATFSFSIEHGCSGGPVVPLNPASEPTFIALATGSTPFTNSNFALRTAQKFFKEEYAKLVVPTLNNVEPIRMELVKKFLE
jgi:hypothetical protein